MRIDVTCYVVHSREKFSFLFFFFFFSIFLCMPPEICFDCQHTLNFDEPNF
uniref:Uncharacterized protein n=1 Tax=Rhizophora mucronata TaxID=61149 RepID=A0A2P2NHN2_RHIMU